MSPSSPMTWLECNPPLPACCPAAKSGERGCSGERASVGLRHRPAASARYVSALLRRRLYGAAIELDHDPTLMYSRARSRSEDLIYHSTVLRFICGDLVRS